MNKRQAERYHCIMRALDGLGLTVEQSTALLRAERVLSRWSAAECGDGNERASWAIERDEDGDGKPYKVIHWHDGRTTRYPVADKERGALRRVAAICAAAGLHYYHQNDPRGCALYVSREPLTDSNYTRGVGCCYE